LLIDPWLKLYKFDSSTQP